ncbi:2-dehydro-3-deoxygalactonokinase [Sodalis sp. RH21]|uniref:2-dehydro-3-deoxygalactonokinase n=1 Tax=unclassified Sodalis (in: enterobacteria) TaxID=2636512 RepID=UPI0039B51061
MNYISVDWGTSNFRAMRVKQGRVVRTVQSEKGVARCPREQLGAVLREELMRLGDDYNEQLPVILCGMIGSNIGIVDAGYLTLPVSFHDLVARGIPLENVLPNPVTVRPGICSREEHEICRGEEMQLAGALTIGEARVFAAVGTHSNPVPYRFARWAALMGIIWRTICIITIAWVSDRRFTGPASRHSLPAGALWR